jgi:succinate-semialdehyde dehydrogenase/glutarate-semialdehyde dehydrogenase
MSKTTQTTADAIGSDRFDRLAELVTLADRDREEIPVEAPFTGEQIGTVPACTTEDVALAAERARAAQEEWAARPIEERTKVLENVHEMVLDRQDELLDLVQLEGGKARMHAFEEIADVAVNANYYANEAERYLSRERRQGAMPLLTKVYEYHHPVGVVGLIMPWNYPLTLVVSDSLPALVAGNSVVVKPANETPFSALTAKRLLEEAGLPEDVFQVVTGGGETPAGPLIEHSDYTGFTGSTAVGRTVAEQAGANLNKCSLELGGKNPMIVLDDADLGKAVDGAVRGCFTNAGQLCIAAERLYVQSGIYEEFVERFAAATERMTLGTDYDYGVDMGSLVSEAQLEKVVEHVEDARSRGATVLTGGEARPDIGPYFYEPTILTDVDEAEMAVGCEETFGPVVSVYEIDDVEEAIRRANDSEYGLNASIWTEDSELAHEIAPRIECGTVNVNEGYACAYGAVDAPMGGMKNSGIGRRHGEEGIRKYTESQTVAEQKYGSMGKPPGVPGSVYAKLMTGSLRLFRKLSEFP